MADPVKKKPEQAYDIPESEDNTDMANQAESAIPTDKVDNSPVAVEAAVNPPKEENPPAEESMGDKDKSALARTFTGATPALLGMLFGASPLTAEDQIVQGQKYYAGGVPKKLVTTVGPDGSPVYTDIREAVGEKAYQKPLRPAAGGLPKPAKFIDPKDPSHIISGYFDPINKTYGADGKVVVGAYEPEELGSMNTKTAGGTDTTVLYNKRLGLQGPNISGPIGEAALKGQGSEQYKTALDLTKQYPKEVAPLQQKVAMGNATLNLLASPDKGSQAQGLAQAPQYLQDAKVNVNGINISMPPGFFDKWTEVAVRAATGKASADEINGLIAAVQQTAAAQKDSINSMASTIKQAAGPEAAKMMNNNIQGSQAYTPKMPTVSVENHPSTGLMIKKAASILANPNSSDEDKKDAKEILRRNGRL